MVNTTLGKPVRHIRAALFLHMSVLQHQFQGMDAVFGRLSVETQRHNWMVCDLEVRVCLDFV